LWEWESLRESEREKEKKIGSQWDAVGMNRNGQER